MRILRFAQAALALSALTACSSDDVRTYRNGSDLNVSDHASKDPAFIRLPIGQLTPEFVQATGFNRDHAKDDHWAFGYIERDALDALSSAETKQVTELDAWSWARGLYNQKTLELTRDVSTEEFEENYHNYEALTAELQRLADQYPDIVSLMSAGRSVQGRELWMLKISDNAGVEEQEPNLLYIGNMHGDEVVGRELLIYLGRQLASEYATSDRIKALVDNAQIFIMPSMNPDGFENRRRGNAANVDLNRNFPDFTSDPRDVPGNRQPETKAVMELHNRYHFTHALNFHGGDVCFNMPWDTKTNRTATDRFGDDPLMVALAREYAEANPTMRANSGGSFNRGVTYGYEWYEVDGGLQDWSNYYRRSFHATIELSHTKWPAASHLPIAWQENKESMLRYLEQGIFGIHLNVTDDAGAALAGLNVGLGSALRTIAYDTGVIHRATLPGIQSVTLSKDGYESQTLQVEPTAFDGTLQTVVLRKLR